MTPEPKTKLVSRSRTALSIELNSLVPKSSPRMRRASPYAMVPLSLKPMASVDLKDVLNCDATEAARVIERTPQVQMLLRRGLLEVI
jgi:hypothetical protein